MNELILPNGVPLFHLAGPKQPLTLYSEMAGYLDQGIEVHEGDVVFDVGGNIGVFATWIHHRLGGKVKVYSFEPIPPIFEVLRANAERTDPDQLKVFNVGLSRESKTMTFAFYPVVPGCSTAYPDEFMQLLNRWKPQYLSNMSKPATQKSRLNLVPPFLRSFVLGLLMKFAFRAQEHECEVRTLSQVIRDEGVERIDLLKIDVELSELDVLEGIEDEDWPKIRQAVMELHDSNGSKDKISDLFTRHGLSEITLTQTPGGEGSPIYNLYASRPPESGNSSPNQQG